MVTNYRFYFEQPWWLALAVLAPAALWLAWGNLAQLGRARRLGSIGLRVTLILLLAALLARPNLARKNPHLTLMLVMDRSQSVPEAVRQSSLEYLARLLPQKTPGDQLAVIDVAEAAGIARLPSADALLRQRNTSLTGAQSRLADGLHMALALAPPDTAVRILLVSDGNETAGDLRDAARRAAANGIPVDVLTLRYQCAREVVFKQLVAPPKVASGQTVALRFILNSTAVITGRLHLSLNGKPVDLAPDSEEVAVPVELKPGLNVKTVSIPTTARGMHEFEATFVPDDPASDTMAQNNRATAITLVAGPGRILIVDNDGAARNTLADALRNSELEVQYLSAPEFPEELPRLMDTDAIILADTECANFSLAQQELLCRYVNDLGGGLIMIGGPHSFGAGGWIGSPLQAVLPVDLDPPQKKQMPKGALVLIMHACEMENGNYWGKMVATTAVSALSRQDLAGVLAYNWQGSGDWTHPLSPVGDRKALLNAIKQMEMGDMPDFHSPMQAAYQQLKDCDAAQKHIIIISDGDPAPASTTLLDQLKAAKITCTGVAIFPHQPSMVESLQRIAQLTGGRFYHVNDPTKLPQIFIKEAQVVRRALIVEQTFAPKIVYSLSEITRGLAEPLPRLDGYVLTGPKAGLANTVLSSATDDPILASCQAGLGRCVAFTSSIDSRWASGWLQWGGFERFWDQAVRWVAKPAGSSDCEIITDIQGRDVNVQVEALDADGKFVSFAQLEGQIIAPDASARPLSLTQVGPGQYQGRFQAAASGSYIVNLRHKKIGENAPLQLSHATVTVPFAPEFRDLSDNLPLLTEVSAITNGRLLNGDSDDVRLFEHAGLKFPDTPLPLLRPLMLAWLGLFLLDVAIRRVSVDFRAAARRLLTALRRKKAAKPADPTLEQLKLSRLKVRQQLHDRAGAAAAARRYTAPKNAAETPLAPTPAPAGPSPEKKTPAAPAQPAPAAETTHIQELLKAKRAAKEKRDP